MPSRNPGMRGTSGMSASSPRRASLRGGALRRRTLVEVAGLDEGELRGIEVSPQGGDDVLGCQCGDPLLDLLVPVERPLEEELGRKRLGEAGVLRARDL